MYPSCVLSGILALGIFCNSCSKPPATSTDHSKTRLLTAHTWIYQAYYTKYNTADPGLVYQRGGNTNSLDLSANKVNSYIDGSYSEEDEHGHDLTGTWQFINNQTQTVVYNSYGTYTPDILRLDDTHYS
ncbi:MAG TPA: hypothetical protein VG870_02110 [Chitinophagaceae bacterium]|nr:hypothetical protein [Chitinophagaceae bacterium]